MTEAAARENATRGIGYATGYRRAQRRDGGDERREQKQNAQRLGRARLRATERASERLGGAGAGGAVVEVGLSERRGVKGRQ